MTIQIKSKNKIYNLLVDDKDYIRLDKYKLYYHCGYIRCHEKNNDRNRIMLHRLIMDCPENMQIDHIDMNKLNNKRCNLRICNNSQNQINTHKRRNKSSKYKGVCWQAYVNKWESYIYKNYKKIRIGFYNIEVEAARKYNEYAKKYYGEYAYLNKV